MRKPRGTLAQLRARPRPLRDAAVMPPNGRVTKPPDRDEKKKRPLRGRGPAAMFSNISFILVVIAAVGLIAFAVYLVVT